jgi:ribosomal protein S6
MNNYELLYILPSGMTGTEIKSVFEEVEKEIKRLGGEKLETLLDHPFLLKTEISKEEGSEELKNLPVIKRKLAYPIKRNRFGFYCLFNFKSEGINVKEIDTYLKSNSRILRHLLLQADPLAKEELTQLQKLFARKRSEQEKESKKEELQTIKEEREKDSLKIIREKKEIIEKEKKERETVLLIEREEKSMEMLPAPENNREEKETTVSKKDVSEVKIEKKKVEGKIINKEEKKEEKEQLKDKKTITKKKKKIKLEDLEDKLDEILEDTMI